VGLWKVLQLLRTALAAGHQAVVPFSAMVADLMEILFEKVQRARNVASTAVLCNTRSTAVLSRCWCEHDTVLPQTTDAWEVVLR
jgi:hypothetical protein